MAAQHAFQRRLELIEELLQKIDAAADPDVRAAAHELIRLVMELHATSLERLLEITDSAGEPGRAIIERLGRDEGVAGLLILHGFHPCSLEERVAQALEKVRLRGGDANLLSVEGSRVRIRLPASRTNSGGKALRPMVEEAIFETAPDVTELEIEGGDPESFVPLTALVNGHSRVAVNKGVP